MITEAPVVLHGASLTRFYGPTCAYCDSLTGPDRQTSQCPVCRTVTACRSVDFQVARGEILGIVGESGSGKSTLLQIANLTTQPDSGSLVFHESTSGTVRDLLALDSHARRVFRNQRMGIVHQRPELGLNLSFSVGGNVAEKLLLAEWRHVGRIRDRVRDLMLLTELPPDRMDDDPHTFSGGMLQRVQIAKALASDPEILLLDEVTSGLDLSVQARVLDLIRRLQWELGIAMLVVSHDLGVIRQLARRTMVMKNGHVVEHGLTDQIMEDPRHPYTQLLVSSAL